MNQCLSEAEEEEEEEEEERGQRSCLLHDYTSINSLRISVFPPWWAPLIMPHDCTKATNHSPSSWCQGKLINMQFLLCVSICCSCVLRCSFDAAIIRSCCKCSLWPRDDWTLEVTTPGQGHCSLVFLTHFQLILSYFFAQMSIVKQLAFSVDSVYLIHPESFSDVEQIDSLTPGWRHWQQQPCCGSNRGKEFIDIIWLFLISINSETKRDLFCCSGGSV